jgi:GNAT superfamily N-acetyltransferase
MRPVVRATSADLNTLSQIIADAFHDLPPSAWLIADPAARRRILPGYFRLFVEYALADGVVHTTLDRSGVALWLPLWTEEVRQPVNYPARLLAATLPWTRRFMLFDAALGDRHPHGEPHHHLALLAVRPDRQGQGIGSALLDAYHAQLDREYREPGYLEAADERSRRLYARHGYADHGPPIELPDGPSMYPMWREPRGR